MRASKSSASYLWGRDVRSNRVSESDRHIPVEREGYACFTVSFSSGYPIRSLTHGARSARTDHPPWPFSRVERALLQAHAMVPPVSVDDADGIKSAAASPSRVASAEASRPAVPSPLSRAASAVPSRARLGRCGSSTPGSSPGVHGKSSKQLLSQEQELAMRMRQAAVALGDETLVQQGPEAMRRRAKEIVQELKRGLEEGTLGPANFDDRFTQVWPLAYGPGFLEDTPRTST